MLKTTWRRSHLTRRGLELGRLEAALQQRDRLVVPRRRSRRQHAQLRRRRRRCEDCQPAGDQVDKVLLLLVLNQALGLKSVQFITKSSRRCGLEVIPPPPSGLAAAGPAAA
jgi:hypothetical protein